jgi:hypothetical protein
MGVNVLEMRAKDAYDAYARAALPLTAPAFEHLTERERAGWRKVVEGIVESLTAVCPSCGRNCNCK